MPSSHSQFMFFFSTFAFLHMQKYFRNAHMAVLVYLPAFVVAYSRVYLTYHSIDQVLVGAALGIVIGYIWWILCDAMYGWVSANVVNGWIGRLFKMRDTRNVDVLAFDHSSINGIKKVE